MGFWYTQYLLRDTSDQETSIWIILTTFLEKWGPQIFEKSPLGPIFFIFQNLHKKQKYYYLYDFVIGALGKKIIFPKSCHTVHQSSSCSHQSGPDPINFSHFRKFFRSHKNPSNSSKSEWILDFWHSAESYWLRL